MGQPEHEYEIDGAQFSSKEELLALLGPILAQARLIPEGFGTGGLDALNDELGGWFNEERTDEDYWPPGKPASFILRWKNSAISRERLSMPVQSIEGKEQEIARFSSEWVDVPNKWALKRQLRKEIRRMKRGEKVEPTVFEVVVKIFRDHAPGGEEMENEVSGVTLLLE